MNYTGPGLYFKCLRCGNCCKVQGDYSNIYLSIEEMQKIAKFLQISLDLFMDKFVLPSGSAAGRCCVLMPQGTCVFYGDQKCDIHWVKPVQCAAGPFIPDYLNDDGWKEEVKAFCPGIGQGTYYPPYIVDRILFKYDLLQKKLCYRGIGCVNLQSRLD